jgi:secondary thiamine-phosphate synthase enzyme
LETRVIQIETRDRLVTDITPEIRAFCASLRDGQTGRQTSGQSESQTGGQTGGQTEGLCSVFAPHATAGLGLMERGSGSEEDLAQVIERILPGAEQYRHRHGSPGHGRDHVLPIFISPSIVIPVLSGSPALGTWQSVVLVDPNIDNPVRNLRLSFIGSVVR